MLHWRDDRDGAVLFRRLTIFFLIFGSLRPFLGISKMLKEPSLPSTVSLLRPIDAGVDVHVSEEAIDACLNPPKHLLQPLPTNGKVVYISALIYGTILDILLQVFGTAAVWGSADCFGVRGVRDDWYLSEETCRALSYCFSFISAGRYIWRIYKYKMDGGYKNCSAHYESLHAQSLGGSLRTKWKAIVYCFGIGFCSLAEGWKMFEVLIFTKGVGLTPQSHSSRLEISSFLVGYSLHFILRVILEVLGAAGAVWGIFEVLLIRNKNNGDLFSRLGFGASMLVLARLSLGFGARHLWEERASIPGEQSKVTGWCWRRNAEAGVLQQAYQGVELITAERIQTNPVVRTDTVESHIEDTRGPTDEQETASSY